MRRRDFILASMASLTCAGLDGYAFHRFSRKQPGPEHGFLMGEGLAEVPANPKLGHRSRRASLPGAITLMGPFGKIHPLWETPFLPHLVKQNPWRPDQIVGVQKWGPHVAVFSYQDRMNTKWIQADDDFDFFGHVEFLDQGRLMAVSAHNWKLQRGEIHLFECDHFQKVKVIPSFGDAPHDIQVDLKNPNLLIVANSGTYAEETSSTKKTPLRPAQMSWINWQNQELLKSVVTPNPKEFLPAHFHQSTEHRIFIYGPSVRENEGPSLGVFDTTHEKLTTLTPAFNPAFKGECLNAFEDLANQRLWVSVPSADRVLVFNHNYEIIKELKVGSARSLTQLTPDVIFISSLIDGNHQQLAFEISSFEPLTLEDLRKKMGPRFRLPQAYGAHTTLFKNPMV